MTPISAVCSLATNLCVSFQKAVGKNTEIEPVYAMRRIQAALEFNGSVSFGETHGNYSHASLVTDFMPYAAAAGADRLYVEMFHCRNQKYIDQWQDGGDEGAMVWLMNRSPSFSTHMWSYYWDMLKAAKDNGLRVVTMQPDKLDSVYPGMEIFYRNMKFENVMLADQKEKGERRPFVVLSGEWHLDRAYCSGASALHEMLKGAGVIMVNGKYCLVPPIRQTGPARMILPVSPYQTPIFRLPTVKGAEIRLQHG